MPNQTATPPYWINRTIWTGDNLDIMRGMNSDSVDLIYLGPPFNSNRTYAAPIVVKDSAGIDRRLPGYRAHKHTLFGRQEGICAGCEIMFPFRNMTIDHVVPCSKGGNDHLDKLQLLRAACNSMKGDRSQPEFIARLTREGIRTTHSQSR